MRISDWSSDVCSSDLSVNRVRAGVCSATLPDRAFRRRIALLRKRSANAETLVSERISRFHSASIVSSRVDEDVSTPSRSVISSTIVSLSARIVRSEEHTSELQSLMRTSYAVFCLKKKKEAKIHLQTLTRCI